MAQSVENERNHDGQTEQGAKTDDGAGRESGEKQTEPGAKAGRHKARELILVGISGSPHALRVVRAAGRLALQMNARLEAVYVESKQSSVLTEEEQKNLEECKNLARAFGASIITAYGEDIAYQLAETAKVSGARKLFIGMSARGVYRRGEDVGVLTKKYMPSLDIYIIPGFNERRKAVRPEVNPVLHAGKSRGKELFALFLWLFGVLFLCTAAGVFLQGFGIPYVNIVMVYILGVLILGTRSGSILYMALASFSAVMAINFFFVEPLYCFRYDKPTDLVTFLMIFAMTFILSALFGRLQYRFEVSHRRNMRTDILFDHSTQLLRARTAADVEQILAEQLTRLTGMSVIIYEQTGETLTGPKYYPRPGTSVAQLYPVDNENDRRTVEALFRKEAGEDAVNGSFALYLPVAYDKRVYLAVGLYKPGTKRLPAFELGVINSMLNEAGLVMNRILN